MPGLFHEPLSRRETLRVLGASAAGGWLHLASGGPLQAAKKVPREWHVALLSDTHIPEDATNSYRGFKPVDNLRQVVPQIVAAKPAAVMLSGDAARLAGLRGDYRALRKLLQPVAERSPILIGLGNHDDRRNFFAEFPSRQLVGRQKVSGRHVTMLEHPALRIVMLDSLLYVNKVAGLLGKAQRSWLQQTLPKLADRPLVLFVHHTLGDGDGDLLDAERLFTLIKPHPHVKAIFYGHSHQYNVKERDGVQLVNLPACGYNFNDREPVGWVDARFRSGGVQLTLHAIGGNRTGDGKTTNVTWMR